MTAADRQRRYRKRRRNGDRVARVVVDLDVIDMLVAKNHLSWGEIENPAAVETALNDFVQAEAARYA